MSLGGEGLTAFAPKFMADSGDGSAYTATIPGASLQSLLDTNAEAKNSPSELTVPSSGAPQISFLEALGLVPEGLLTLGQKSLGETSVNDEEDRPGRALDMYGGQLKMPKVDIMVPEEHSSTLPCWGFQHLPKLNSLESIPDRAGTTTENHRIGADPSLAGESSLHKLERSYSSQTSDSYTLDAIVRSSYKLASPCSGAHNSSNGNGNGTERRSPAGSVARRRRQSLSDKIRCLQRLLPSEKKMETATVLDEANKYIRFLRAQISVLQSMPSEDSVFAHHKPNNNGVVASDGYGALGMLNRQQLLQVVVNSPVAQTMMYSRGCCVYSIEQLALATETAERRAYLQQMLFNPSKRR